MFAEMTQAEFDALHGKALSNLDEFQPILGTDGGKWLVRPSSIDAMRKQPNRVEGQNVEL
jgi:hypothetical protein